MEHLPGVVQKVDEYTLRIVNGEDIDAVLDGADTFRPLVEARIAEYEKTRAEKQESKEGNLPVVPQEKIQERIENDNQQIKRLEAQLHITPEEIEERKKLSGWPASYKLAEVAKELGINLALFSREEYAQFAIDNYLAIDDGQLRAQPWQRNQTSVEDIVRIGKEQRAEISTESEKHFARFSFEMMELATKTQQERYIKENVRVLSGTKDSNSWLFFSINEGTNQNETDTYKSYFSLKDLNAFSPDQFVDFMETLQKKGYNGGVKIFQDLTEQGTRLNDQVVMHGYSEDDAKLALDAAKDFFKENIQDTSFGKDEIVDGESKSYSKILAENIRLEISKK